MVRPRTPEPAPGYPVHDTGQHPLPYTTGEFRFPAPDPDTGQFPALHDTGELRLGPYDGGWDPDPQDTGEHRFRPYAAHDSYDPYGRYDTGEYPAVRDPGPAPAPTPGPAVPGTGRRRRGAPEPVRGGHPEQREPGGGWGPLGGAPGVAADGQRAAAGAPRAAAGAPAAPGRVRRAPGGAVPGTVPSPGAAPSVPRPRTPGPAAPDAAGAGARTAGRPAGGRRRTVPGPRHEDVAAFDALDARLRGTPEPQAAGATAGVPGGGPAAPVSTASEGVAPPPAARSTTRSADGGGGGTRAAGPGRPGRGRAFTGVAAAAVTTVLAVVVAGQVSEGAQETHAGAQPQDVPARDDSGASRGQGRPAPARTSTPPAAPATYAEKMARKYPLDPRLAADGSFATIPGRDKAPGTGPVTRYRVDVERGLPLDGELFAEAVHRTLNDDRSWGHGGARTFERVSSGRADFVITLASPATTAKWCAKSGLDTTVDNVSCDSASTERVMINAYRWAQGAATYGDDKLHTYRQMLINHEVGHRLGRNHEFCSADGALAPVMMQQTKFLTTDGATCRINAWPYPTS